METSERNRLVKQRAIVKGSLTRIGKFVDQFTTGQDVHALQTRLERLPSIWEDYMVVQDKLELDDDNENCESHANEREVFENTFFNLKAKVNNLIEGSHSSRHSDNVSSPSSVPACVELRLPVINLPSFHGQYEAWIHFHDTFHGLIVKNDRLSNIQRFHYLLSSLKGEPHQLIQNLPISGANFPIAWETICRRYTNKKLIATQHVNSLLSLPSCQKATAADLRQLSNHVTSNLNALESLQLEMPLHEILLQQLILDKLDSSTRKEFEMQAPNDTFCELKEVTEFLEGRAQMLELIAASKETKAISHAPKSSQQRSSRINSYVATSEKCNYCNESHPLHKCQDFIKTPVRERYEFVKKTGLCFNCFRQHRVRSCKSGNCRLCHNKHHTLIHFENEVQVGSKGNLQPNRENSSYCSMKVKPKAQVILSTALVQVLDANGRSHECRALLDCGSQTNFITEFLAKKLKLKRHRNSIPINGINNTSVSTSQSVNVRIRSTVSNFEAGITCSILPQITGNLPATHIDCSSWNLPTDIQLADPGFNKSGTIDMLIGAELYLFLLLEGTMTNGKNLPVLKNSVFGWLISGPIGNSKQTSDDLEAQTTLFARDDSNLGRSMERFWSIDEVTVLKPVMTKQEQYCEDHFVTHTRREDDGRFVVKLPVREDSPQLGNSYSTAMKRFMQLEQRLCSRPELKADYVKFMEEYYALDHMQLALDQSTNKDGFYYMPHHAVIKSQSTTTKTRVVFDASCKSDNGVSLNSILTVGPTVQQDLLSLVTRFRTYQVALTADIAKMYRQVRMHDEDINLQRILWRKDPSEPVQIYQLKTVTYGTSSASFLATRCLLQLAADEEHNFPHASRLLRNNFYVDDLLGGAETVEEAIKLRQELQLLLQRGGFTLRKWCSSHQDVMESIAPELQEANAPLRFDEKDRIKTLGLSWHPAIDEFRFEVNLKHCPTTFTKRNVLSIIASIFDPLGLLGPVIILAKILMQELWKARLGWDEPLVPELLESWKGIYQELPLLNDMRVGRMILGRGKIRYIEIHGFSDASERAYAACVYVRSIKETGECSVHLVCSKSRVSPLKQQSIPRLELCGALLLSRLAARTSKSLNLTIDRTCLWTDSTIVIAWLAAEPTRWKTFVANRVSEIQGLTEDATWGHVSSEDNPADILSRGKSVRNIKDNALWWHGPTWLGQDESHWPDTSSPLTMNQDVPDHRTTTQCLTTTISLDITSKF